MLDFLTAGAHANTLLRADFMYLAQGECDRIQRTIKLAFRSFLIDAFPSPLLSQIAQASKTGGSNGGTMRYAPESTDGANAGLHLARDFLEPVKKQFPWITYGDLWTLVCAAYVF